MESTALPVAAPQITWRRLAAVLTPIAAPQPRPQVTPQGLNGTLQVTATACKIQVTANSTC